MIINDEEALLVKTDVTLEQLEELQAAGRAGVDFAEAVHNMGNEVNITDQDVISQLRYAHSIGVDDAKEESPVVKKEKLEPTEEESKRNAEIFMSPLMPLMVKHKLDKNPINSQSIPDEILHAEFKEVKEKIMNGDKGYLYEAILSQLGQMQQMSIRVNMNLESQDKIDIVMKYANIQLKLMAEQRRTIQALDDLMTPKKTTFVKEVSQHNHFSEKKDDIPNELNKPNEVEVIDAEMDTEAERATKGTDKQG